jgi:hypothetical protein
MHLARVLGLGLVVVGGSSLAANRSKDFCAAWMKAAATGKTYEDTLAATLNELGEPIGEWGKTLGAVAVSAPGFHVALLRGGAERLGETFSCPSFESPAGRPQSTALLTGEKASAIEVIGSDGEELYVVQTARVAGFDQASLLEVKNKGPSRVLAAGLPRPNFNTQLVFTPTAVIIAVDTEIIAVPRAGGLAKHLVSGLKLPSALTLDGDGLVFIDDNTLQRVPLAGGEVQRIASVGAYSMRYVITGAPEGFLVAGLNEGKVLRIARSGAVTTALPNGAHSVFAGQSDLFIHLGSNGAPTSTTGGIKKFRDLGSMAAAVQPTRPPEGTYRLSFADAAPVRIGPWIEASHPVVRGDEVFAFEGDWPGRRRLIRWKLGAATPALVASPVGQGEQITVGTKRVFWHDHWFDGLYAQPR